MEKGASVIGRLALASFVLANFMIAPILYNPRLVSWQPGYFEIGILNTQDDAVGEHGQKMLHIPPTDGIFSDTKVHSKTKTIFAYTSSSVLGYAIPPLTPGAINEHVPSSFPSYAHPLQSHLCTFLI